MWNNIFEDLAGTLKFLALIAMLWVMWFLWCVATTD